MCKEYNIYYNMFMGVGVVLRYWTWIVTPLVFKHILVKQCHG